MRDALAVAAGGVLGALARWWLSGFTHRTYGGTFALGTLAVNVIGCFVMGAFAWSVEGRQLFGPTARLFVVVGFLGSLTTFSAFSYDTFALLREGSWWAAFANVAANVLLCIGAVLAGWTSAKALFG